MVAKQIIVKNKSPYLFSNSVLIKDFNGKNLKIAKIDCGDSMFIH